MDADLMNPKGRRLALVAGIVCWVLLALSAGSPAFHLEDGRGPNRQATFPGWALLLFGWLGLVSMAKGDLGWGALGWCANLGFFLATVALMLRQYRIAIPAGAAAVAVALTSFQLRGIHLGDLVPKGEIVGYGAGFFLWLAAMGLSFVAPTWLFFLTRGPRPEAEESAWPTDDYTGG
jgi:hypothetical protein